MVSTERTEAEAHTLAHVNAAREWVVMVKTDASGEHVTRSIRVRPERVAEAEAQGWEVA
jgi:hypothetical protein